MYHPPSHQVPETKETESNQVHFVVVYCISVMKEKERAPANLKQPGPITCYLEKRGTNWDQMGPTFRTTAARCLSTCHALFSFDVW